MIRKTVHLVRTATRQDSIEVIVEASAQMTLEVIEPTELWNWLLQQGCQPQLEEDVDSGIELFLGNYDPRSHAGLPVIDLHAEIARSTDNSPKPCSHRPTVPRQAKVMRLERQIEQHEIKRFVVEGASAETIEQLCGDDIWRDHPEIQVEVDEHIEPEFMSEASDYDAADHSHLPFLESPQIVKQGPPSQSFLSGWQPSSTAVGNDVVESERVGRTVGVEPSNCYHNARRVIRSLPEYTAAAYIEGFVVTHDGAIFEHGWLVKDGKIIDPTILDVGTSYFPGLEFIGREQIRAFLQTEYGSRFNSHPFHEAFGTCGVKSRSFLQAFESARECLLNKFGTKALDAAAAVRAERGLPWPDEWR